MNKNYPGAWIADMILNSRSWRGTDDHPIKIRKTTEYDILKGQKILEDVFSGKLVPFDGAREYLNNIRLGNA